MTNSKLLVPALFGKSVGMLVIGRNKVCLDSLKIKHTARSTRKQG